MPRTDLSSKLQGRAAYTHHLDTMLLDWGRNDVFTLGQACQGVKIFGGTGSGKTSGSGRALAHAYLQHGFGGLVLCAKPDEVSLWQNYTREAGRDESVMRIGGGTPWRINFLDYILARYGIEATNLAVAALKLIADASRVARSRPGSDGGQFWEDANHQMLMNTIPILYAAWGRVRLDELYRFIQSAPQSDEQATSKTWQDQSFLFESLRRARETPVHRLDGHTEMACSAYWRYDFARLDPKTRANIVITMTSLLSRFAHGRLHDLFCTYTTFVPELCFQGAILVLDMPVKTWQEDGIIAQHIIKYLWQRAVESRAAIEAEPLRPVFLWADECQFFVNEYDAEFQSTARSARATTVYLTQNLPTLFAKIGGQNPEHFANMLLGNLMTSIFHANGCTVTNRWASEMIGQGIVIRASASRSSSEGQNTGISKGHNTGNSWSYGGTSTTSFGPDGSRHNNSFARSSGGNEGWNDGRSSGVSWGTTEGEAFQEQKDFKVDPAEFSNRLRTGGQGNDCQVDAIVVQPGRRFNATAEHYRPVTFRQEG